MCRRKPPQWARELLHRTDSIARQLKEIKMLVQVEQSQLDELDAALDDVTAAISEKLQALIDAGTLPAADVSALLADVDALKTLVAPTPAPE
ncbi:MAG: hypothetical protein WCO97_07685 [bacterium]